MRRVLLGLMVAMLAIGCAERDGSAGEVTIAAEDTRLVQDRFRVYRSELGHIGTLNAVLETLDRRDLSVFTVIDHAAAAAEVGMSLPPTTLVIFGNPRAGTPLINDEPLMGAELPLRALVYERGGQVFLAVTGVNYLEREYALQRPDVIDNIEKTLDAIAREATSP